VLEWSFLFKQRHFAAGEIVVSLDSTIAEVVGGMPQQGQHGQLLLAMSRFGGGAEARQRRNNAV
jgi:hypothetical protein